MQCLGNCLNPVSTTKSRSPEHSAAEKIQSGFNGFQIRQEIKKLTSIECDFLSICSNDLGSIKK